MVVYLSLGSNIGDREKYLRAATTRLANGRLKIHRTASVYITEPRDYADQDWFLNTVIEAEVQYSPVELLEQCLAVEKDTGRVRTMFKGPRTLDIDIIFYDSLIIDKPGLHIPHPRYPDRRFVLTPLVEIAAEFIDPQRRMSVRAVADLCSDHSGVNLYRPPLL